MAAAPQGVESTTTTSSVRAVQKPVTTTQVDEKKTKPKRDCRTMWSARVAALRTKRAIAGITIFAVIAIILISLGGTHILDGNPRSRIPEEGSQKTSPQSNGRRQFPGSIKNGTALRVMVLGASTAKGENSPEGNGFRKKLRDELTALGAPVNMVGSVKEGNMPDNECEAQGGARISEVFNRAKRVVPEMQPNVFLINAGVNNALQLFEMDTAGRDMENMVNYLLDTSPRSFVVISTLLTNTLESCEQYMLQVNEQLWDVFAKLEREGKWVLMADMHPSGSDPDAILPHEITPDGTHPTAEAYDKMGHIFAKAIQRADKLGYVQVPVPNGIPDDGNAAALAEQNAEQPLVKRIAAASDKAVRFLSAEEGRTRFMLHKRKWCGVPDKK
ncbi:carbohydrate esterase family 3 protein [Apiospora arundinis]|uniref:Carbohydrate esterase family 3 protein n=1 Tax=Apiospora arundinis TaxID=335852 RepID=A0ABR2HNZ5_9PEZI